MHHQSVPPCPRCPAWQEKKTALQGAVKLLSCQWGRERGGHREPPVGDMGEGLRPTWGFSVRPPLVVAAVMSVKSWNTFCKKINKERMEMEIMSPWKLGGGDEGSVLRCARPTQLSWEVTFRMKEVGSRGCGE